MKNQYIIGQNAKRFIRIYEYDILVASSLTLEEAEEERKRVPKSKIYKLVEIKK